MSNPQVRRAPRCPCGSDHLDLPAAVERLIETQGETIDVMLGVSTWSVPRIYIAMHGLRACELRELAARYGWAQR